MGHTVRGISLPVSNSPPYIRFFLYLNNHVTPITALYFLEGLLKQGVTLQWSELSVVGEIEWPVCAAHWTRAMEASSDSHEVIVMLVTEMLQALSSSGLCPTGVI
jgi:hypothetical protein